MTALNIQQQRKPKGTKVKAEKTRRNDFHKRVVLYSSNGDAIDNEQSENQLKVLLGLRAACTVCYQFWSAGNRRMLGQKG